jgi:signal transduction histidine kinase
MRPWLRGRSGGLLAFVVIVALVVGGLGYVTRAALDLDLLQRRQQREAETAAHLRVALWKLDRIASVLAREDSRPFNHYSAIFVPPVALSGSGMACSPGTVIEPSPLLGADLPDWMVLHFQITDTGWESPQVPSKGLTRLLQKSKLAVPTTNITEARRARLERLGKVVPACLVLNQARQFGAATITRDRVLLRALTLLEQAQQNGASQNMEVQNSNDYVNRSLADNRLAGKAANQQAGVYAQPSNYNPRVAEYNARGNGEFWLNNGSTIVPPGPDVPVKMSPLLGVWLPGESAGGQGPHDAEDQLAVLRLVRIEKQEFCQGILLDADRLRTLLLEEVRELFPNASLLPVHSGEPSPPERTMSALPFQLDPGEDPSGPIANSLFPITASPLNVGLTLAWTAAGVALLAVGLGGWSLIDLSERRIRFVSAVTHELRTPLTTLRLYLDMLLSGLVRDKDRQADYLRTLHAEADRLNRLVANVLDFSRLENRRPRISLAQVPVGELLAGLHATWRVRCQDSGKEMVLENTLPEATTLLCDGELLQQVLGNLIDNACKYTREAADPRLWLRARADGADLVLEIEDRGPGVPRGERRSIFRAFRRGASADVVAGGVGLGLALARRWAKLLGARLELSHPAGGGACFQVRFPRAPAER